MHLALLWLAALPAKEDIIIASQIIPVTMNSREKVG